MKKSDIINDLGRKLGLKSYLGISTPTTGHQHICIDEQTFSTRKDLLVYNAQPDLPLREKPTFCTASCTSYELVETLRAVGIGCYDLVFVDPFHSYENSYEDIIGGFSLLRPGGVLVVHDCNPASAQIAAPEFVDGAWCGLTYWAFIDFVLGRGGITYYTVDTDYGCGVVFNKSSENKSHESAVGAVCMEAAWAAMSRHPSSRYRYFDEHRKDLLRLISPEEFYKTEGLKPAFEYVVATEENFDEDAYLAGNPGVEQAVKAGKLASGRAHFDANGKNEGRKMKVKSRID